MIDRVGAVVESPKFSPNFTGRQNLQLLARTRGIADDRVDAALDTVEPRPAATGTATSPTRSA